MYSHILEIQSIKPNHLLLLMPWETGIKIMGLNEVAYMDQVWMPYLIFLDFAKAFDKVPHSMQTSIQVIKSWNKKVNDWIVNFLKGIEIRDVKEFVHMVHLRLV